MLNKIRKRDGRVVRFDSTKIADAIFKAAQAVGGSDKNMAYDLSLQVCSAVEDTCVAETPTVEFVQDVVEKVLIETGHAKTAKAYILYRKERSRQRDMNSGLMKVYEDLTFQSAIENDVKRENANIDGDTAMGTMLKYGSEGAKKFNTMFLLEPRIAEAHQKGDIHIHDFDFYSLTTTCMQIDLLRLFHGGFSTGHGFLREPNEIQSYSALACIAIQANQNDQHGGQSVPNFDYAMAPGVAKTYWHRYRDNLAKALEMLCNSSDGIAEATALIELCDGLLPCLADDNGVTETISDALSHRYGPEIAAEVMMHVLKFAERETERATYQAMEALVHNLNTMHSRAGAQIPFSSLNYGTDTSPEGRLIVSTMPKGQKNTTVSSTIPDFIP